jgi:hypothetical protein
MATPRTPPALASLIEITLQTREVCRVYSDTLSACWPEARDSDTLTEKICSLAGEHRWEVEFREFGKTGVAAEFRKRSR